MSVEGLLSEVSTSVKLTPVLFAGEQNFYGDKMLYTNVEPRYVQNQGDKKEAPKKQQKKHEEHEEAQEEEHNPVLDAIQTAKHAVQSVLGGIASVVAPSHSDGDVESLRKELSEMTISHNKLRDEVAELRQLVHKLSGTQATTSGKPAAAGAAKASKGDAKEAAEEEEADEDFDLFGSEDEEESEEQAKVREQRLADYAAKKAKKGPGPVAKSSVILDVKPWDDETDLKEMEEMVREIEQQGLVWGAAKLVPVGYGINKLQIVSTIEDDKVSVDDLIEKIQAFEDHVQSVDIVAFNKV